MSKRVYILGPMRGIPYYNFLAFDAARDSLLRHGCVVESPADGDRYAGFDGLKCPPDTDWSAIPRDFDGPACVARDLTAIQRCTHYHALPGWANSTGARAEQAVCAWIGLPAVDDAGVLVPQDETRGVWMSGQRITLERLARQVLAADRAKAEYFAAIKLGHNTDEWRTWMKELDAAEWMARRAWNGEDQTDEPGIKETHRAE